MNFRRFSSPPLQHGLMKLVHFPGPQPGAPEPLTPLLLVAAVIEVIGGGLAGGGPWSVDALMRRKWGGVSDGSALASPSPLHAQSRPAGTITP
jgi:hypothetical protein